MLSLVSFAGLAIYTVYTYIHSSTCTHVFIATLVNLVTSYILHHDFKLKLMRAEN